MAGDERRSWSRDDLWRLLESQARIRVAELVLAERYPDETMRCPVHLSLGQEIVAAAAGLLARPDDVFMGNYRSHGHYLAKGGSLRRLFAEILGRRDGCAGGYGGSMHLIDRACGFFGTSAIVGGTVPIAAGLAFSARYRHLARVSVAFFGDAAVEEGILYETINFAQLHGLPLLCLCENNGLAVEVPLALRAAAPNLHRRFESMGVCSASVNGRDVLEVLETTRRAYDHVRAGRGPYLVEYALTRFSSHVGPSYSGPVDAWSVEPGMAEADACPLAQTVRLLVREHGVSVAEVQSLYEALRTEASATFQDVEATSETPLDADQLPRLYASGLLSRLPEGAGPLSVPAPRPVAMESRALNPF